MTLEQAQKQYADALQLKLQHKPYCMTPNRIQSMGTGLFGKDKPAKILFQQIGKTSSRIIASRQAYLDDINKSKEQ